MTIISKEDGFTILEVLLTLVIAAFIGAAAYTWHHKNSAPNAHNQMTNSQIVSSDNLSGTVTEGPISPVCYTGQNCGSSKVIANHTVEIINSSGQIIATTKTSANGYYSIRLKPGQYILKLVPFIGTSDGSYPVNVKKGSNQLNVSADSGIR